MDLINPQKRRSFAALIKEHVYPYESQFRNCSLSLKTYPKQNSSFFSFRSMKMVKTVGLTVNPRTDMSSTKEGGRPLSSLVMVTPGPREALIRSMFRTACLESVRNAVGTADEDGELCALNEVLDTGETLLHLAVSSNRTDVLLYLLEQSLAIDEPDSCDQTALHLAANEGNLEMVKILLEHGADPFLGRNSSFLPMSIALGSNREILSLLMAACGRKMRDLHSGHSSLTVDGRRNLSRSEPSLATLVARTPSPSSSLPRPNSRNSKRAETLPARIPAIRVVADEDATPLKRSASALSRGATERKSLRMRVDSFVSNTLKRRSYTEIAKKDAVLPLSEVEYSIATTDNCPSQNSLQKVKVISLHSSV